jgi:hypothetical protein
MKLSMSLTFSVTAVDASGVAQAITAVGNFNFDAAILQPTQPGCKILDGTPNALLSYYIQDEKGCCAMGPVYPPLHQEKVR